MLLFAAAGLCSEHTCCLPLIPLIPARIFQLLFLHRAPVLAPASLSNGKVCPAIKTVNLQWNHKCISPWQVTFNGKSFSASSYSPHGLRPVVPTPCSSCSISGDRGGERMLDLKLLLKKLTALIDTEQTPYYVCPSPYIPAVRWSSLNYLGKHSFLRFLKNVREKKRHQI